MYDVLFYILPLVGCQVPVPPEGVLFHIGDNVTEIDHDQDLSYTCDRGFDSAFNDSLLSFPTIQCVGGVWEGATPSCEGMNALRSAYDTFMNVYCTMISQRFSEVSKMLGMITSCMYGHVHDCNCIISCECHTVLMVHDFLFADKDECELNINDCNPETSICVNTLGSYVCHCKEGFVLGADGRTCEGRNGAHSYGLHIIQVY